MSDVYVSDAVKYIGVNDKTIDLFESQYVVPNGVSYNSYVIMDEKIAVMDTVDKRGTEEWLGNLEAELGDRTPDYLVVQHMEPDHAGSVKILADKYPSMQLVANAKTFTMMEQFFDMDLTDRKVVVKEMDTLSLGAHTLTFVMAPMVHWPEVMVSYESTEKILFAADGFGKFGALDAALDIAMICPLTGPVLKENLGYYIEKYDTWSSYRPEDKGILVAYASIHGNTRAAVEEFAAMLEAKGAEKVVVTDLARDDMAEAIEDAYRYDRLVVACPTYDGSVFPCMEDFLYHLKIKNFQNRKVGIIENGSWAPQSGKLMTAYFEGMKDITLVGEKVTIKSSLKEDSRKALEALADAMVNA